MDKINISKNAAKNKKIFIILGLIFIFIFIVVAIFLLVSNQQPSRNGSLTNNINSNKPVEVMVSSEALKTATSTVTGGNPVTKDGEVIATNGLVVKNDARAFSDEAPIQTSLLNKAELPDSVIKLEVFAGIWQPNNFTVKAGDPVTLAISSNEDFTHIFKFNDPILSAVKVFVSPNQTRAITFKTPDKVGEYIFSCDVPGHVASGEVGKMIVK